MQDDVGQKHEYTYGDVYPDDECNAQDFTYYKKPL